MPRTKQPATPADRFKSARIASGLSQAEVARQIGTARASICQIESGVKTPTPQWLLWAAATLGWDAKALDPELGPLVANLAARLE